MVNNLIDFMNQLYMHEGEAIDYQDMLENKQFGSDPAINEFRKKVALVSCCFKNIIFDDLADFFTERRITRDTLFTLLTTHCFKMCEECDNIFICMVYCCSFTLLVLKFCSMSGYPHCSLMAPMCMEEIAHFSLMETKFNEAGGMEALRTFALDLNLPEILKFVEKHYIDHLSFTTMLVLNGKQEYYSLPDEEVYQDSKIVWDDAVKKLLQLFDDTLRSDANYTVHVANCIIEISEKLDEKVRITTAEQISSVPSNQIQS